MRQVGDDAGTLSSPAFHILPHGLCFTDRYKNWELDPNWAPLYWTSNEGRFHSGLEFSFPLLKSCQSIGFDYTTLVVYILPVSICCHTLVSSWLRPPCRPLLRQMVLRLDLRRSYWCCTGTSLPSMDKSSPKLVSGRRDRERNEC